MANKVRQLVSQFEGKYKITFKPTSYFYDEVNINQKRWGQILRGDISPTLMELQSIAKYFDIKLTELFTD